MKEMGGGESERRKERNCKNMMFVVSKERNRKKNAFIKVCGATFI